MSFMRRCHIPLVRLTLCLLFLSAVDAFAAKKERSKTLPTQSGQTPMVIEGEEERPTLSEAPLPPYKYGLDKVPVDFDPLSLSFELLVQPNVLLGLPNEGLPLPINGNLPVPPLEPLESKP